MRKSHWKDYELFDTSQGERLERFGSVILIRPDPQIIWKTPKEHPLWGSANARYVRSFSGGGRWQKYKKTPETWSIHYEALTFQLKLMGFKHTGIFPEQATNWDFVSQKIEKARQYGRSIKILNLFAYTGAATLACAKAGAEVCHVDASKGMVEWARENAVFSGLKEAPIRWLVDDCIKFVQREKRRGNHYNGIIMDPPSYGRGHRGEVWKLEEQLFYLLNLCLSILSQNPLFLILNSYTTGLSPSVMQYLLSILMKKKYGGFISAEEIALPVTSSGLYLPCGSTAIWESAL